MARITAMGLIVDSDGNTVVRPQIVLQGFGKDAWITLSELSSGEFQVELPERTREVRLDTALPLRLVDHSTQEVLIVAADPMWVFEPDILLADFGDIRLLKEPYHRKGIKVEGDLVIGEPQDREAVSGTEVQVVIRKLRNELADSRAALVSTNGELDVRTEQLNSHKVRLASVTSDLDLHKEQLTVATHDLGTVRTELSAAIAEVGTLRGTLGTPTKVLDVISGLGSQLSATNIELAKQPTPFRLAEVKLDLRGRLGSNGDTIVMDGKGDGSGLSAELVVDASTSAVPTQGVPSVSGLTESAAARVLRSVGFRMDTATQLLAVGTGVPGQAVAQHPAAGQQAEFGTSVLVVFGVRSENHE